jgi:hypothetical protein
MVFHEMAGQGFLGHGAEVDAAASGEDGGEEELRLGGEEDEGTLGRRLLQGLKEGVGGLFTHVVGAVEDKDAGSAFEGLEGGLTLDGADVVDADFTPLDGPMLKGDDEDIGVVAGGDALALPALAAGPVGQGGNAVDGAGDV